MATMTMLEAVRHTLHEEMARDERVMVLGQDVGTLGGVFRATEGLRDRFGAERVVDTPLSEGAIVGASLGLAWAGMVPVAEIQFLGFTHQAFHQVAGQLARIRARSGGRHGCQATLRAPFGGGVRAPELHSDSLEAQFAQCAGLKIAAPASAADAKGLLTAAIRDPDPVLVLEPLRGYRAIIAWSAMVQTCLRAALEVEEESGASIGVLDLRTLVPLDVEAIVAAAERTGRVVVAQEAPPTAGFASEVVATVQEEAFYALEAPIARVSGFDTPYPPAMLEERWVPDVSRVAAAVRRTLEARA